MAVDIADDDPLYYYDDAAADRMVGFFPRYLRLTKGKWRGRPFKLAPWQADDIVRPAIGVKRKADGLRRYTRVAVWVARKNGKTELAAGLGLGIILADQLEGGEAYAIATNEAQARIVFDKAADMVKLGPLQEQFTLLKNSVFCDRLATGIVPMSGSPKGKHGYATDILIGDEMHEWPDDRLYQFLHQATASSEQPFEFLISTAGVKGTYGEEFYEYCVKVRDGLIDDPELLVVIYEPEDDDDWTDEATWRKANPNMGESPRIEYLRTQCNLAKDNPRIENDFKRYHLNMWTEQAVRWVNLEQWDKGTRAPKGVDLWKYLHIEAAGRECYTGLDLASTNDIAALVHVFPPLKEGDKTIWLPRLFCPADTIKLRSRRDRVLYDKWADMGALITTPGNVTDYRIIKQQIFDDAETFIMRNLAIDRWNASQISIELQEEGLPVELYGQGFASMSAPSKEFERLVLGGLIEHGRHPVLRWMVGNVAVRTDPAGNIKPDKERSSDKIDGVVAGVMGEGLSMSAEPPAPPSYLENSEMVFA